MNKLILMISATMLSCGWISESQAEIHCDFSTPNKVVITGSGNDTFTADACGSNILNVENIEFGAGVTAIGDGQLWGVSTWRTVSMPYIKSIGDNNFRYCTGIQSITVSDELTDIAGISITDPRDYPTSAFNSTNITEINCVNTKGQCEAVQNLISKTNLSGKTVNPVAPKENCSSYTSAGCSACASGYAIGGGNCHACGTGKNCHWDETAEKVVVDGCKDNYLKKESECVASSQGCGANFRLNDGECDRIRYTPAEAAAAMNGDDNTITITFKK